MLRVTLILLATVLGIATADAQQSAIYQTMPTGNGGYWIMAPGQQPIVVQPWLNGYSYGQIGQQPTTVVPLGPNSFMVTSPQGQPLPLFGEQ